MEIKTIVPTKETDFDNSINLLNLIFSKYPNNQNYNSKFAFERTAKHDPLIVEVRENNQTIGFCLCYQRYPNYYHIWDLGVEESFRGRGVASKIYDTVEEYAKNKKYLGISINTFNRHKDNIRLLIKRGYEICGLETEGKFTNNPKINLKFTFK